MKQINGLVHMGLIFAQEIITVRWSNTWNVGFKSDGSQIDHKERKRKKKYKEKEHSNFKWNKLGYLVDRL